MISHYDNLQAYFTPKMLAQMMAGDFDCAQCPVPDSECAPLIGEQCGEAFLRWLESEDTTIEYP